jgi:uncharacterized membrane protein YuzA (DUF378 family)
MKIFSLVVIVFGITCSVLMGLFRYNTISGVPRGIAFLALNTLFLLAEIKPSILVHDDSNMLLVPYGRSAFLVGIVLLYATSSVPWFLCWMYFWFLAIVYFIVGLCGDRLASSVMNGCCGTLPNNPPIVPVGAIDP